MKDNTDKFHLILTTRDSNQIQIGNSLITGSLCEKLFSVKFDHKLAFDQNIKSSNKVKRQGSYLRIWSHLLKKSLMENFIFLCSECLSAQVP